MNFPQLCYQFKDLVAFSVAEFEFDKNQAKPCLSEICMGHLKSRVFRHSASFVVEKCKILPMLKYVENAQNIQKW